MRTIRRGTVSELSRRTLLGGAVAAVAASVISNESADAQYVWTKSDWQAADFDKLVRLPRRIKQVVHADSIDGGRFLRNVKNSLNALHFAAGVPDYQVQIVCALNGSANM